MFVGREQELAWLEQRLDRARSGRGRVVFITAEPGAGKSSLVSQFLAATTVRLPDVRIIGADCSEQFGAAQPYEPFIEAFRGLLTTTAEKTGNRWSEWRGMAAAVAPAWIGAIPVAGAIISASLTTAMELKKGGTATAAASEEALFFQYAEMFFAVAARQTVLLFIDDLHWADSASVSLLNYLARRIRDRPVLIVGSFRPADVDVSKHPIRSVKVELERYGVAEELPLPRLDRSALAKFIEEDLGAPGTPELLEWLDRQAGENPLFFGELLRWLVDQGFAAKRHGEWALVSIPESIAVPQSAESAIERRLSRLDPEIYKLIEYASVQGNEFDSTTLSMVLGQDELELEEALEPIVKVHRLARLVETRDLPNGDLASTYQFTHSLVQDVLHSNLQGKRRILLHRRVAEALEGVYAKDLDPVAHRLAFHYDEGRNQERAYAFAMRGSTLASRMYAHRDAVALIRRALRNAQNDEDRLLALDRLGDASHVVGAYAEALEALTGALDLAQASDTGRAISIRRRLIEVEQSHGGIDLNHVQAALETLAAEARSAEVHEELCHILWRLNQLPAQQPTDAITRNREALEITQRLNSPPLIARARFNLGLMLVLAGEQEAGHAHLSEALRIYGELGDHIGLGRCRTATGIAANRSGDLERAAQEFTLALQHYEKAADPVNRGGALNNLGATLTQLGDWDAAESHLKEAVRIMERLDANARVLSPLENLSYLHFSRQDWSATRDYCKLLLDRSLLTGHWHFEVIARSRLGMALLHEGDVSGAIEQETAARSVLKEHPEWFDESVYCDLLTAELAAARGDAGTAVQVLEAAEPRVRDHRPHIWAELRLARGRLAATIDRQLAVTLIREAVAAFGETAAAPVRARAENLLATLGEQP
ncbi:MAG TPA: AAA family ATPase [Longimicrobiales bacterium]|nr:AAA family ATPase [Longimicrobiales bacterium]